MKRVEKGLYEMPEIFMISVAVENAIDEVKKMCDVTVSDYREDGFAEAVECFVL